MEQKKRLEDMKAGDLVYYTVSYGHEIHIVKIDRLTKSQIICGNSRFQRKTGIMIGHDDPWSPVSISPITDQVRKQYEQQKLRAKLRSLGKIKVTDENYEAIAKHVHEIEVLGVGEEER